MLMTFREQEMAALQARITKARAECEVWRASGMQDKYIEAWSLIDALELQRERLGGEGLRSGPGRLLTPGSQPPSSPRAALSHGGLPGAAGERARTMAQFSITYNGRQYQYDRYRYDRLEDAVNRAKFQRTLPRGWETRDPVPPTQKVEVPDESQRRLMASLAITFDAGVYRLGSYRYDRLVDAVSYARLRRSEER